MNTMTEEERKEKERIRSKKRYWANLEKERERSRKYSKTHKAVRAKWHETKYARASNQYQKYKRMDKHNGFGDVIDFTPQWIVDSIYTKPCVYCGETDWHKLGCNRIDNSKGHTKDNVEPCCYDCNVKLAQAENGKRIAKRVDQIDKVTGEVVCKWASSEDTKISGFNPSHVGSCARGERKTHKGYYWKRPM